MKNKLVVIWDLDGTVIDSAHRTPIRADGTLDLPAYLENHIPKKVMRDTLMPLIKVMQAMRNNGAYTIILTARGMAPCDYHFLAKHGITYDKCFSREQATPEHAALKDGEYKAKWILPFLNLKQFKGASVVMFDDSSAVKKALRKHFPVLCATRINAKMGDKSAIERVKREKSIAAIYH